MESGEAATLKFCSACGKTKTLSRFRYILFFQKYRSICKDCEAQQKRKRRIARKKILAERHTEWTRAREQLRKQENAKILSHALGLAELQVKTVTDANAELNSLRNECFKSLLQNLLTRGWLVFAVTCFSLWILHAYDFSWFPAVLIILAALSCTAITVSYGTLGQVAHGYTLRYLDALREKGSWQSETILLRQSLKEKSSGFPTLMEAMKKYDEKKDEFLAQYLRLKERPSVKAVEVLREQASLRRETEANYFRVKAIIDYYESIAPFLVDLKDDIYEAEEESRYRQFNKEERSDPVTDYLTEDEFRSLSSAEKSQLALDRYWKRPKSKRSIGRIYERYIGYLYEEQGYDVEYIGIFKGFEDLGRDLICRQRNEVIIVQCKYWSQFKTIYEKHIFQFFGTVFQYKDENPGSNVRGTFCTTTQLSPLAHRLASQLGIEIKENFRFDESYPSIKCNVSRIDGSRIYHLPFDQQYDNVKVEKNKGELECAPLTGEES